MAVIVDLWWPKCLPRVGLMRVRGLPTFSPVQQGDWGGSSSASDPWLEVALWDLKKASAVALRVCKPVGLCSAFSLRNAAAKVPVSSLCQSCVLKPSAVEGPSWSLNGNDHGGSLEPQDSLLCSFPTCGSLLCIPQIPQSMLLLFPLLHFGCLLSPLF